MHSKFWTASAPNSQFKNGMELGLGFAVWEWVGAWDLELGI